MNFEEIEKVLTDWKNYQKYFDDIIKKSKPKMILGFDFIGINENTIEIYFSEYWADLSEQYRIKMSKTELESPDVEQIIQGKVVSRIKAYRKAEKLEDEMEDREEYERLKEKFEEAKL